jgi:hypothetical protein
MGAACCNHSRGQNHADKKKGENEIKHLQPFPEDAQACLVLRPAS